MAGGFGRLIGLLMAASVFFPSAHAQWVAYNDHASGPGTHPNATRFNIMGDEHGTNGFLKSITTGTDLPVRLIISRTGSVLPDPSGGNPATGTPLDTWFGEYVDFAQSSIPNNVGFRTGGFVVYTFSGLDQSKKYSLMGGAVRGSSNFTNRWARIELANAEALTANHSPGVLTSAQVPADLGVNQAAINSGANHTPQTGDIFRWDDIAPGPDGIIELICTRYSGTVPGGNSGTATVVGYAPVAIRLEDVTEGPVQILTQPASQIVDVGQSATFNVIALGHPVFYQWFRGSEPIPGATKASYTLNGVTPADSGVVFSVVVSNRLNAVKSDDVIVFVSPATTNLMAFSQVWHYDDSVTDLGTAWRETDYDDSSWPSGPGLLGFETATLPEPLRTVIVQQPTLTYYFRTTFEFPFDPVDYELQVTNLLDDGAVFYLNGIEWFRVGMPNGTITHNTPALETVGDAAYEALQLPAPQLIHGLNVIAVEVHQVNSTSTDVVFGMHLDAFPLLPTVLVVTAHPENQTVLEAEPVSFSVEVSGHPVRYQWFHDDVAIPDATRSTLEIAHCTLADAGTYHVKVYNGLSQKFSQPATLNVLVDTTPPVLLSAQSGQGPDQVLLTFSEDILPSTAVDAAHYQVSNSLGQVVQVLEAQLVSPRQVLLRTHPRSTDLNYMVIAHDITDTSSQTNPIEPGPPRPVSTRFVLASFQNIWDFYDPFPDVDEPDLGTAWKELSYQPDSAWGHGPGAFVYDLSAQPLPVPARTGLSQASITKYFRHAFDFSGSPLNATLQFSHVVDDGAIVYLNGQEVYRYNLPQSVDYLTPALTSLPPSLAMITIPLALDALQFGPNVLAVELHASGFDDLDSVFAGELTAEVASLAAGPVIILRSPSDLTVVEGQPAVITFEAIGAGEFQWFENGTPIPDATQPELSIPHVKLAQSGAAFHVRGANQDSSAASDAAILTVIPDTTAPTLVSAHYESLAFDQILVTFSEPVDVASASSVGNYALSGGPASVLVIQSASVTNENQVRLKLTGPLLGAWALSVHHVRDTAATPNVILPGSRVTIGFDGFVIGMDSTWKYEASGTDLGTAWRTLGYDDAAWQAGPGVLGFPDNEPLLAGESIRTPLPRSTPTGRFITNFYFRTTFDFFATDNAVVTLTNLIDDGAIFYLNETEVARFAMPNGFIAFNAFATRQDDIVSAGHGYDVANLSGAGLLQAKNVLAVDLRQGNSGSLDLVFGSSMHVFVPSHPLPPAPWLVIRLENGDVVIEWTGTGSVLEASDRADAPNESWITVNPQENPYRVAPAEAKKFYRLKGPN